VFSPIPNLDHRLREVLMAIRIRDNMALVGKSLFLGQAQAEVSGFRRCFETERE